jgi:Putative DNA-binding domain
VPDLATFQRAFAGAIGASGRRGRLERQPGFAVYRNTAPNALIGALAGNFPVTAQILGGALFDQAALAFIRAHPPKDAVLIDYGAGFADHLEAQDWLADLPYLPGVAAIERLCLEAQNAADAPLLGWAELEGIAPADWESLRLPLHPACRFVWLSVPALTIWQAHRDGFETLEPEWRAEGALITRLEDNLLVQPIDAPTHRMLFGLLLRESAGQAAAATAATYPEADIASIFATLVNSGALAVPPSLERKN